jgi:hypothetical protein
MSVKRLRRWPRRFERYDDAIKVTRTFGQARSSKRGMLPILGG